MMLIQRESSTYSLWTHVRVSERICATQQHIGATVLPPSHCLAVVLLHPLYQLWSAAALSERADFAELGENQFEAEDEIGAVIAGPREGQKHVSTSCMSGEVGGKGRRWEMGTQLPVVWWQVSRMGQQLAEHSGCSVLSHISAWMTFWSKHWNHHFYQNWNLKTSWVCSYQLLFVTVPESHGRKSDTYSKIVTIYLS